ncbi:MAG: hypothetical protein ACQESP_05550 [Candidatus Muiribacteriota bacterium]
MLKKILIFLILFFTLSSYSISYFEQVEENKNNVEESFEKLIQTISNKSYDEDIINLYLENSKKHTHTILNKDYFYIKEAYPFIHYGEDLLYLGNDRFLISMSNHFKVFKIDNNSFVETFSSQNIGEIFFTGLVDMNFNGNKDITVISNQGLYIYFIDENSINFGYKNENKFRLEEIYEINSDKLRNRIAGVISEEYDPVYGFLEKKTYFFSWLFPGLDRRNKVIDEKVKGKILFMDLNNNGYVDLIDVYEKKMSTHIDFYINDLDGGFNFLKKEKIDLSGFIDFALYDNNIYFLGAEGIIKGVFKKESLNIESNLFNIVGGVAVEVTGPDKVYVMTLKGEVLFLNRLTDG